MKASVFTLFTILIIMINAVLWGGLVFEENFAYTAGQSLTDNGWTLIEGTGGIPIVSPGLTYSGTPTYPSQSGNAISIGGTTEDDYKTFSEISSNSAYISFLFNASDASTSGADFIEFGANPNDGNFYGRVWAKKVDTNLEFSISMGTTTTGYTDNNYNFDETYLIVVKYEFITGENNDEVSLFVFPSSISHGTEPETPTLGPVTGSSEASEIGGVLIKQATSCPTARIDGIRVGTEWDWAPLPVTLSTFTAQYINNKPTLCWETQSETDNMGWNIYRNTKEVFSTARKLTVSQIEGHGTTTEPSYYNFEDTSNLQIGQTYYYWLESIDYSGTREVYSKIAQVTIPDPANNPQSIEKPTVYDFTVAPNPVSTNSQFKFTLDKRAVVSVSIYNVLGELVKTLPSVIAEQDKQGSIYWNGKDNHGKQLSSGVYFYNLIINYNISQTKKFMVVK